MPNNEADIGAVAAAAAEIVKTIPVYQDAVQPVAQEIGKALKTLGGVINVALIPIATMIYGFDRIKDNLKMKLEERLAKTSPENIITPKLQIVGPLLEKYKFVYDNDDLSQMFVNLLANAMDKNQISKAHPSFGNIITELSPDEARLLKTIKKQDVLPKLDVIQQLGEGNGYIYIMNNFTVLGEIANLAYPELTSSYLSNLERLNIIVCSFGKDQESYSKKEHYKSLEEHGTIIELKNKYQSEDSIKIETVQGIIRITEFGKMFMDAVL